MSIENLRRGVITPILDGRLGRNRDCFYCGRDCSEEKVAVVWYGVESVLLLHPACALRLGTCLVGDGFIAQRILTGRDILENVDKTLLPVGEA